MTTINNEMEKGFITIQDWMFELGLTGNDVIVYALIYGFSQDNRTWFNGSLNYIMQKVHVGSKQTIINVLGKLEQNGLIKKRVVNYHNEYMVDFKAIKELGSLKIRPVQKLDQSGLKIRPEGSPKIRPYKNIYKNNSKNIEKEIVKEKEPQAAETTTTTEPIIEPEVVEAEELKKEKSCAQKERKTMERPTLDEVRAKIMEKGYSVDAEAFWNYYESNGWKVGKNPMKKWESALVTWQKKENEHKNRNYGTAKKFDQKEYLRNEYRKTFGVEPDF